MGELVFIKPERPREAEFEAPSFPGVSDRTCGARSISMKLLVLPPGASTPPHRHVGYESAVYLVSGEVEVRWGDGLSAVTPFEPGTFCFLPPGVPHVVANLSATDEAKAIVARDDPSEDERVEAV
jgi:uncharacterized RmlC-like cupin family protein